MGLRELDPAKAPGTLSLNGIRNLVQIIEGANGCLVVGSQVKDIVEALDSARHQFLSISFVGNRGASVDETRHLLNVHTHQASIIDDQPSVEPVFKLEETRKKMKIRTDAKSVNLDRSKLSPDIHLWREDRYRRVLMMSDAIKDRLSSEGIYPFKTIATLHGNGFIDAPGKVPAKQLDIERLGWQAEHVIDSIIDDILPSHVAPDGVGA